MMDDDDATRYPPNPYGINRGKNFNENGNSPRNIGNQYVDDDNEDEDDEADDINSGEQDAEDDDDDADGENGVQRININDYEDHDDDYNENGDLQKHPKKRNLRALLSSYEFAPRVPASSSLIISKRSSGGRNPLKDWTEPETFILLDAWGERFLKQGTKSLRSEEWQEVAEKVSNDFKTERSNSQCRNRLDTLKKKYKKEKMKSGDSEWVYFKKMDTLLSSVPEKPGLSCGVDSGEFVFMNPKVYLSRSNGLDEMRDSPGNSESTEGEENYKDPPPKRTKNEGGTSLKLIADSIHKFSEIYEKIEASKREQMVELEKMRMDLFRDLEFQRRRILEKAQAEIAKIRQGEEEENDLSAENDTG